jgi:hypothetical protein
MQRSGGCLGCTCTAAGILLVTHILSSDEWHELAEASDWAHPSKHAVQARPCKLALKRLIKEVTVNAENLQVIPLLFESCLEGSSSVLTEVRINPILLLEHLRSR